MAYKITLIPGDGIGPEVTQAAVRILEATGLKFEWEVFQAGAEAFEKYHEYIPKELIESPERERKTSELGELIMNRLRRYDKVAYVRFASVYLDFKDVKEFMTELKDLLKTKETPEVRGKSAAKD